MYYAERSRTDGHYYCYRTWDFYGGDYLLFDTPEDCIRYFREHEGIKVELPEKEAS